MFQRIFDDLKQKHVFVSEEWLAFTLSTFSSANVNANHVYRKLLNCDLKTVKMDELHALPIDLFDQTSAQRNEWQGKRVVQLISVYLSNAPFIETSNDFLELPDENSDDEFSSYDRRATIDNKPNQKVKGPRLLSLILTDGKHEFKAIEYKPIAYLNENMPYGTKLLLKGPMEIQMGIMFLRAENIEVLGGLVTENRVNGANTANGNVDS